MVLGSSRAAGPGGGPLGVGLGNVSYSVPANDSGAARTGTITIGTQTFTITQAAGTQTNPGVPQIDPDRTVENGASYAKGQAVAAGSFVVIYGSNFAPGTSLATSVPLPLSLANVSVTFNNVSASLIAVNQNQINAQIPWNVLPPGAQTGTAQVVVTSNGASSAPVTIQVTSAEA